MGFTIPELLGGGIWSILVFSVMVLFIIIFFCPFLGAVLWRFGVFEALLGLLFFRCVAIFLGGWGGGGGGGRFPEVSVSFWCQKERNGVVTFWGSRADILGPFRSILGHFNPF